MGPDVYIPLLTLLLGSGGGGLIVAIRKERREGKGSEVELLKMVRELASEEVSRASAEVARSREERDNDHADMTRLRADLDAMREELTCERRRSAAMETALRDAGIPIPPWPPVTDLDPPRQETPA